MAGQSLNSFLPVTAPQELFRDLLAVIMVFVFGVGSSSPKRWLEGWLDYVSIKACAAGGMRIRRGGAAAPAGGLNGAAPTMKRFLAQLAFGRRVERV